MLICSTPWSKGLETSVKIAQEIGGIEVFTYEGSGKRSRGWESWPMEDGVSHRTTILKKWISDDKTLYHIHLLPTLSTHQKALNQGRISVILREPHDIIGSLPFKDRNKDLLDQLRVYYQGWLDISSNNPMVEIINYNNLVSPKTSKSSIVGIAKNLGFDYKVIEKKPYNIVFKK